MRIQEVLENRSPTSLNTILGMLLLVTTAWAQGTVEYRFTGQVRSLNPASEVFAGIAVGSPVEGWFTIDYTALDSDPSPNAGSYSSAQVAVGGTIGASDFGSIAHPGNQVRVVDGLEGMPGQTDDWTILEVVPGDSLVELSLTFHDSAGQAINGPALPASAASFSAFPDFVLYTRNARGAFGQYSLNVEITQVPEPSVTVLSLIGLVLLGSRCLRGRPAAVFGESNAEPERCSAYMYWSERRRALASAIDALPGCRR